MPSKAKPSVSWKVGLRTEVTLFANRPRSREIREDSIWQAHLERPRSTLGHWPGKVLLAASLKRALAMLAA
jgi:hypothetical protein